MVEIAGLHDLPRSGKPPIYGQEFRDKVLETLEQTVRQYGMGLLWQSRQGHQCMRYGES